MSDLIQLLQLAAVIHDARFEDGKNSPTYCEFENEDRGGRIYCCRIARAILDRYALSSKQNSDASKIASNHRGTE